MCEKNERGRTAQHELEILRMSLLRIAQALQADVRLPGHNLNVTADRGEYGFDHEVEACKQNNGWNRVAAACMSRAEVRNPRED